MDYSYGQKRYEWSSSVLDNVTDNNANYTLTVDNHGMCWWGNIVAGYAVDLGEQTSPKKEGVEMKNLYEVFLVYGENRNDPTIMAAKEKYVIADSDEDAKIKSGIYGLIDAKWDADFLTIIVRNLGQVKIKEKAKEVKTV